MTAAAEPAADLLLAPHPSEALSMEVSHLRTSPFQLYVHRRRRHSGSSSSSCSNGSSSSSCSNGSSSNSSSSCSNGSSACSSCF
ncbi:hypothetical protein Efla_001780 [Eimeria flavescens]